ncbi:MAG: hypothetical protein HRT35_38270 [Algicola sp.]|nr:hypothetical protein [Algicola sp.]
MSDQISITMDQHRMVRPIQNKYVAIEDAPSGRAKSKKRQNKQRKSTLLWYIFVFTMFSVITAYAGMGNSSAPAQRQKATEITASARLAATISKAQLDAVEWTVRSMFLAGSWRYDSREVDGDMIHLYIKIPNQLAMETDLQTQYIKSSLCPKADNRVWQFIEPRQMKFHLFTKTKTNNVAATCGIAGRTIILIYQPSRL